MLDMTAAGGYGTLYGPNVDAQGRVTAGEGLIAGTEYTAFGRRQRPQERHAHGAGAGQL
jgi:hypothetical protein